MTCAPSPAITTRASSGQVMNKETLVADVISTWLERGQHRPTLCFAVDRVHAKHLQTKFEAAGVNAGYIDCYTDRLVDRV